MPMRIFNTDPGHDEHSGTHRTPPRPEYDSAISEETQR